MGTDTTLYFDDAHEVIEERDGPDAVQRQFVYGGATDEPLEMRVGAQSYYFHENSIGSISALSDA